jgi:hypothetical protein
MKQGSLSLNQEHCRAELERLNAGFEGCGCAECQALYQKIDLEKYEARVIRAAGVITIVAGKAGAENWEKHHQEEPPDGSDSPLHRRKAVSKILAGKELPPEDAQIQDTGIMKHRGRPRKEGEISRTTAWRRRKEMALP